MWNDICFAQNCAILAFWTIFVLTSSAIFTWNFKFHGEDDAHRLKKRWSRLIIFFVTALFQEMLAVIIWAFPSIFGTILATLWMIFVADGLARLLWKFALKPSLNWLWIWLNHDLSLPLVCLQTTLLAMAIIITALAVWFWPSLLSKIVFSLWALVAGYLILEPIWFWISQKHSQITGA
jgi:hypothetical protein